MCHDCYTSRRSTLVDMLDKIAWDEKSLMDTHTLCSSCTRMPIGEPVECVSLDCSWLYTRKRAEERTDMIKMWADLLDDLENDNFATPSDSEIEYEFWEEADDMDVDEEYETDEATFESSNTVFYDEY